MERTHVACFPSQLTKISPIIQERYIYYLFLEISKRPRISQCMDSVKLNKILDSILSEFSIHKLILYTPDCNIKHLQEMENIAFKKLKEWPAIYLTSQPEDGFQVSKLKSRDITITIEDFERGKQIIDSITSRNKRISLLLSDTALKEVLSNTFNLDRFFNKTSPFEILVCPRKTLSPIEAKEIYKKLRLLTLKQRIPLHSRDPYFYCVLAEEKEIDSDNIAGCSAFLTTLTIDVYGDVVPCTELINYKLGNVLNSPLENILDSNLKWIDKVFSRKECDFCDYVKICGGCPAYELENKQKLCDKEIHIF